MGATISPLLTQSGAGAGIAKSIRDRLPAAYEAELATEKGGHDKLGFHSSAEITVDNHAFVVVNAYTQFHWHGYGVKADYEAIRTEFKGIKQEFTGKRIGYPIIGAGLAGGDWDTIADIIQQELVDEDGTLVIFKPS